MSKNLTRKGIAFGAIVALGTTLFAGAPASAAGIDNGNVSLAPNAGTEYNVLANAKFELKANFSNAAKTTGAYLKFLVEDSAAKSSVVVANSSKYSVTSSINAQEADDELVTLTVPNTHKFKVGDKVSVSGATATTVNTTSAAITAVTSTTIKYLGTAISSDVAAATENTTVTLVASYGATRGTGISYVFDTKDDTNLADKVIRISSTDENVTQSVTVTAWVDQNDNGTIDSTEYQSPARTVNFYKNSDVTATTALRPTSVGDSTVVADVTTVPVLNGNQLSDTNLFVNGAANVIKAKVTRFGDATELDTASTSWSDTTKKWTVTSANFNSANWADTAATKVTPGADGEIGTAGKVFIKTVAVATTGVITFNTASYASATWTTANHGLRVGDKVIITDEAANTQVWESGTAKTITSVPTSSSFTIASTETTAVATTTLGTTTTTEARYAVDTYLRDTVEAGDITVQAYLYNGVTTAAWAKSGVKATNGVVAKSASAVVIEGVSSATVSKAGNVAAGTTSAAVVAKVTDADGAAVAAGIDATITATKSSAGTVKVNGTTVTTSTVLYGKTDANGFVQLALENSSALAGDTLTLDVTVQGVNATQVQAAWASKVYSIVDLNDPSAVASPARTRAVAEGASYTFDLLVQDQFKAVAGADIRVKAVVTGNTEFQQLVTLASGKASLAVADGGLTTGDVTVALTLEKLTGTTWAAITDANGIDWDGNSGEKATVEIKYYTQADALTLNANAANYPSTVAADFSAATTTKALTAVDERVSNDVPSEVDTAAGKAVVSGKIAHATTGAAKSGQVVTISAAGLLFKSGDVWSIGSASQIAADGTFAFDVYSANPGDITVTVAVGSVTKTAKLTFTGASTSAKKLTVTPGSTTYVPGQTVVYTIKLTDGNGNAVDTVAPAATPAAAFITVTYAGPGLVSGSLPVETDASGEATVRIATGTADTAAAVLTVKYDQNFDGDVADTNDLTVSSSVAASNPAASIATLTVTAATTSQAGRAVDVTVKAVDAAGAAVAGATVALSSVGAGSLASSSVVTNASGVATVKLVAGASDLGSAVVTATANAKSGSATVEFGATDATVDIIGKRVYVTTEFAAGKRVTIYDNGVRRYSAIQTSDAEKVVMWNVKSGSHTIVVKISGASSDTVTFLVK
jgi:hypothetical protein